MRIAGCLLLLAASAGVALAQPSSTHLEPRRELTFAQALALADAAPELAEAARASEPWRRAVARASWAPGWDAQAAVGPNDVLWQGELAASWRPGVGQSARDAALAAVEAADADLRVRVRAQRRAVARAWLRAKAAQERLELGARERQAAHALAALAERARAAAVGTAVEEAAAQAYLAEVELGVLGLEGEHVDAALALAELCGGAPDEPVLAVGPAPQLDETTRPISTEAAVAAEALAEVARRRGHEAKAQTAMAWTFGVRGEGDRTSASLLAVLGVSRGGGDGGAIARAAARAEAARLVGVAHGLRRRARGEEARLDHEREHAAAVAAAEAARVKALARQVAALELAHAAGEATLPEVLLVRRAWLEARASEISARFEVARVGVERALAAGVEVRS